MNSNSLSSLSILMPCYNDGGTIEQAIDEAWRTAGKVTNVFEIIVVNDKSRDNSGEILAKLTKKYKELAVITHPVNLGYGATIAELYYKAKYDWLFTVPGDFQIGARELLALMPEQTRGDMILGWRTNRQDPEKRLKQSKIYNALLRMFFGLELHDVNTVRLMSTKVLRNVRLRTTSAFVDAELAIRLMRQDFKIIEVPIAHRMDIRKKSESRGGGGSAKTIVPTIRDMVWFFVTS